MSTQERWGWDLAGAEGPYNKCTHTVVDIADPAGYVVKGVDYLRRDLTRPGWAEGLEPRRHVVLRWCDWCGLREAGGWAAVARVLAQELPKLLLPGGVCEVMGHAGLCEALYQALQPLPDRGWWVAKAEDWGTPESEGYTTREEWEVDTGGCLLLCRRAVDEEYE